MTGALIAARRDRRGRELRDLAEPHARAADPLRSDDRAVACAASAAPWRALWAWRCAARSRSGVRMSREQRRRWWTCARAAGRRRLAHRRWRWCLLAAVLPALVSSEYVLLAASMIVTMLLGVSFNLLFGYAGMFSFGQSAFYGLGAYATVLRAQQQWRGLLFRAARAGSCAAALVAAVSGAVLVQARADRVHHAHVRARGPVRIRGQPCAHADRRGQRHRSRACPNSLNVIVGVNRVYYAILVVAVVVLAGAFAFVRRRTGLHAAGRFAKTRCARVRWASRSIGAGWACSRLPAPWRRPAAVLSVLSAQIVYPSVFAWQISANALDRDSARRRRPVLGAGARGGLAWADRLLCGAPDDQHLADRRRGPAWRSC